MRALLISFACLSNATTRALADSAPIIRGIDARCGVARVRGQTMRCASKLVIMTLPDAHRTAFLMTLAGPNGGSATLTFSGGRDTQPSLGDYTLFVDKVRLDSNGKAVTYEATGTCKERLEAKGAMSESTLCMATAKDGSAFELTLGAGPVIQ